MSIKPSQLMILHYPAPVLRQRAHIVPKFNDLTRAVAERMIDLMNEVQGVGLAAPQVGLAWRMFVTNVPDEGETKVYVNPKLTNLSKDRDVYEEGCLSLPDVRVDVERPRGVTITAFDLRGQPISATTSDFAARVWQHEFDHLNGVLILDRLDPAERKAMRQAMKIKSSAR